MDRLFLILLLAQFTPSNTGELRVTVSDATGLPLRSAVELVSQANQGRRALQTNDQGVAGARQLPFGTYQVLVSRDGFAPPSGLVEIHSATPASYAVTLGLASLQSQVEVSAGETLVDSGQTAAMNRIGRDSIQSRVLALPGRSLPNLVNTQ